MKRKSFFGILLWIVAIAALVGFGYYMAVKFVQKALCSSENSVVTELASDFLIDANGVAIVEEHIKQEYGSITSDMYVAVFELGASPLTLDIGKYIQSGKSRLYRIVPVDKRYYDRMNVGDQTITGTKPFQLLFNRTIFSLSDKVAAKFVIKADSPSGPGAVTTRDTSQVRAENMKDTANMSINQ